jgi:hypothetical protein
MDGYTLARLQIMRLDPRYRLRKDPRVAAAYRSLAPGFQYDTSAQVQLEASPECK